MASNSHAQGDPSTPQSIPLRDLTRPAEPEDVTGQSSHRRTGSARIRSLLRSRDSHGHRPFSRGYARVEGSPSPPIRTRHPSPPRLVVPSNTDATPYDDDIDGTDEASLEDRMGFQAATAGLSFQAPSSTLRLPSFDSVRGGDSLDVTHALDYEGISPLSPAPHSPHYDNNADYFTSTDADTTPLTNNTHLQPISGAGPSTPRRQSRDRTSFQTIHFTTPDSHSPGSRLGDDLPNVEAGLGSGSNGSRVGRSGSSARSRSLSPASAGSPLHRAGSIVRKMSQRVVNLSNEPEIVEQSIAKKSVDESSRLDGPPSLPAMTDYAHDEPVPPLSPIEKAPPLAFIGRARHEYEQQANPLKGKSLGIFSPDNKLRMKLCDVLVHPFTEPFILILIIFQTILLVVDSAPSVWHDPRSMRWGSSWIDYALLALFVIYTLEIMARMIVSGFILNPVEYSTLNRQLGFKNAVIEKGRDLIAPHRQPSKTKQQAPLDPQPSLLRSFTGNQAQIQNPNHSRQQQRVRLAHRAFLRHSFNRLDFVAVVSFWISFCLGVAGIEWTRQMYVFRMMSCLRILRLLGITSGTSVILRSLKKAAPLLVNVAFLIGFFWLLFAIVGVQSFKSSLRRGCVWVDPEGIQANYSLNDSGDYQFCGGYLDNTTGLALPWIFPDGTPGTGKHKGYLCPQNSYCVQQDNPYSGTVSFDNILQSLEMIFVIMTSNTFTDIMYYTTDSDFLAAAIFFAAGIIILSLWLMNLLVAVITSSFQVIREESKRSAFTAEKTINSQSTLESEPTRRIGTLKRLYEKSSAFWVLVIAFDMVCMCFRSADMSDTRELFIDACETIITLMLLVEIFFRFAADWRNFFKSKRNMVDLGLAVVTTIIQIPVIHNSGRPYAWLTIFQILRIYRVVLAVGITRRLILVVFRNVKGLINLIIFVFLITFLAAIFAVQLFRGEIPAEDDGGDTIRITFSNIYNAFIGMYQILSSENWTEILYDVTAYDVHFNTAWIGAAFLIMWYILANFIVLNMFIAVIQENFDVSEDEKRMQQVKTFLQRKDLHGSNHGNLSLSTIFRFGRSGGRRRPMEFGKATMEMLLKDAVVRDFLDDTIELGDDGAVDEPPNSMESAQPEEKRGCFGRVKQFFQSLRNREINPFYSRLQFSKAYDELDPRTMAKEVVSATERQKRAQREYLVRHPTYNVSLFIFKPSNPVRRFCQRIVGPARGDHRVEGVEPIKPVWYAFSAFIYAAIVAMVLLACVTTPLYQREYFLYNQYSVKNWFVFTDMGFAALFTLEALIKVIADGFFWTPNAYFRGSWGFIDGVVLVTLWINVATSLYSEGSVSRAVGAFKALRALRLLNVSDSARDLFHAVIIRGGTKVISAMFVSLSLLIPFAIYGLNLFNGQMFQCNDGNSDLVNLTDCVNEFMSSPYAWDVLAPRQVSNPYYSFDNFGEALFILFQIVSQEGWVDVMWSATDMAGINKQPQPFASQGNAIFFVIFNLLGAVFVLTLFVSVFMRNYTEETGVAFLTADQRAWLELRKRLRQISPSKRPTNMPEQSWRHWCYRHAVKKHGRWQKFITGVLILHLLLLIIEFYPGVTWWETVRDIIFLVFTIFYLFNIIIRVVGLSWSRFRKSAWDLYSIFAVFGTFVTTGLLLASFQETTYVQLHKLFLVSIALLLIPRNNSLDQLFKTAAASLGAIGNLLATWFVLFLAFAIALTQTFGLTRFGENENGNINFRTVPKALILLFRTSCGEGWNQIMEDYATMTEPTCVPDHDFFESDCGSPAWARVLFITWNILSMYIFVSLFVSLIYESFSYVYQRSSGLSKITRGEVRRFKQAWAMFDPKGTGFISKEAFPRLLGELSGVFEMRIYDGDFTVRRLLEDCKVPRGNKEFVDLTDGLDLKMLARKLSKLPVDEIRRRRLQMNTFYEEMLVSADPDRGLSFTQVLMTITHYKVINDNKSLRLEEFLRRRARLQRVDEAVRRHIVIGFFDTIYWSRRFRHAIASRRYSRLTTVPQLNVPEIFVDAEDDTNAQREQAEYQLSQGQSESAMSSPIVSPSNVDWSRPFTSSSDAAQAASQPGASIRARANSSPATGANGSGSAGGGSVYPFSSQASGTGYFDGTSSPTSLHGGHFIGRDGSLDGPRSRGVGLNLSLDTNVGSNFGGGNWSRPSNDPHSPRSPIPSDRALSIVPTPNDSRRGSNVTDVSAQEVLDVLDNSIWGESIRRSFSVRRPGDPPVPE
ncbi:calcium channel subunit Cch1 [Xylona heveae TC161]|uniref:Calcium-channel protein CCH1 n=1 Tax=Xylona heveae (strain CBS 132557 / TC161) TaxID=1328760 RepID=A0A165JL49_XYLHT|nr:calcium channel subunit Cch1 [Xylona heveae TC161]KZF26376.1 calcium channel subunit Cch1 [Xylona heveae TC161]